MRIAGLELPVRDPDALCAFYCDLLGFAPCSRDDVAIVIELAGTRLRLRRASGRSIPSDSRSNDLWFRHIAISVRCMRSAYAKLAEFGVPFVREPVRLPNWNPSAAGIIAAYLRDPEGHPVELIEFPPDKGHPELEDEDHPQYLGIDHTAIVVTDAVRAEAFYRGRAGLAVESRSRNYGHEQSQLSGLSAADVHITSLRGESGIGIELLEYANPVDGRAIPSDTTDDDLWSGVTCFGADDDSFADWSAPTDSDPAGHRVRFAQPARIPMLVERA